MNRRTGLLSAAAAIVCALALVAAKPADAHHFGHFGFGFGFGFPVFYGPAVYVAPPPVYPVYLAPPVAYGYRYRRVYVRHYYHHVVRRHWCSCYCCR
jgi:hypothetical protein